MADEGSRREESPERPAADGWAAHEEAQRRAWQRTTARERLAWLEEAKRFAARAQEARRAAGTDGEDGDAGS